MTSTDIAETGSTASAVDSVMLSYSEAELSYESLSQGELYSLRGLTLMDKDELLGVPHIITAVTYQQPRKMSEDKMRDFVSVEATLGDIEVLDNAIKRGWIPNVSSLADLKFEPGERVVYNDGSTGIRRQLTKMFHEIGAINVGGDYDEEGERIYDRCWADWEAFAEVRSMGDYEVPTVTKNHKGNQLGISAKRGLYASTYSNDYAEDAVTYYLR